MMKLSSGWMKYVDEVCNLLLADVEQKYEAATHKLNMLEKQVTNQHALENAKKDQVRAAEEYLAIVFKTKFLENDIWLFSLLLGLIWCT